MSSEWDKTLLGELIKHKKGFAFKSKDYIDAGTPVIRVSNFTDDSISPSDLRFVDQSVAALNKDVELNEYDIVIATVGSWPNNPASVVGRSISVPSWASGALMNQNAVILRAKTNNPVDQRFLYFQTKSDEFSRHVVSKAQGSANQASITLDAIFSFPIFWPEYFARKEISNFLSAIDDRINLLRETNTTLEAIAQALFKSWFVDFDPVHANAGTQAPSLPPEIQALFPATFTDSLQGPIPEGWRIGSIYDIANITYGAPFASKQFNTEQRGLPLIRIRDLKDERPGVYTEEVHPKGYLTQPGDLVVGMDGEFRAYLWGGEPAWLNQRVCVFKPQIGYSTAFVNYTIKPQLAMVEATEIATTVIHLGKNDIDRFTALIPNESVQKAFSAVVTPIFDQIVEGKLKAQNLTKLRDTLLPRLISGQLRLPEAEQAIAAITD